jgi:hypothetical protein
MTLTLGSRDSAVRRGSDFAAFCRQVRDLRRLDRRCGSYRLRIVTTLGVFAAAYGGHQQIPAALASDGCRL